MEFENIKGVIFDLDGVISNTSRLHSDAWHQVADKVGIEWTESLSNKLKGVSRMESLELILQASSLESHYNDQQKQELAHDKNKDYLRRVENMTKNDILPGIESFLESLKQNHYGLALASASKNSARVLEKIGLSHYFSEIVDPTKLSKGKPDPEIFATAAKLLRLAPEKCLGIEDAVMGIRSINAANIFSIGIGDKNILNEAGIVFENTELLTLSNIRSHFDKK